MVILGVGGHAKEILEIVYHQYPENEIFFFDNITKGLPLKIFNKFSIIKNWDELEENFKNNPTFSIGVGKPSSRFLLSEQARKIGGELTSIISPFAKIANFGVNLGCGLNLMHNAMISCSCNIGEGTLINAGAYIHHNTTIGKFVEVAPGTIITGGCNIGDFSSIGASAVILPKVNIGKNVIVGAGAVVNKNIEDNMIVVGVPAKPIVKKSIK
jgi:sugar O-acyltransferase (sialic acid O-acetyltransferase NeuD family)